jgi:hypothetical protein
MKNQYFGGNKDLFTYDLIWQVLHAGLVNHFTFVPMLTPDDDKKHGEKWNRDKAKAGTENKELMSFLDGCVKEGKRDIKQLERFFSRYGIKMTIYSGRDEYFSHQNRQEYFAQIGDKLLSNSLVFIDPDIGMEVRSPGQEHLLYSEVRSLYERMDESSILMLFQHFPRRPRQEYLNMRAEELKEKVSGDYPICIDDNEVIFFFLTKDGTLEHALIHIVGEYAERYSE